jgi:hypothetical protein
MTFGEWSSLTSGHVFKLAESDAPMAMAEATANWTDLDKPEVSSAIEIEERIEFISS